jgi:phage tail sheath protein FI
MSNELLASKVVVFEEEPKVRGIPSVPTSIAGMVGVAEKGPVGKAILCSSFDEFTDNFGGFVAGADLALAAMGFFENGGSQLWVSRVVSPSAGYASIQVTFPPYADLLGTVVAASPGAFGNRVRVRVGPMPAPSPQTVFFVAVDVDEVEVERFSNLSQDAESPLFGASIINDPVSGSKLIRFTYEATAPFELVGTTTASLSGGGDGDPLVDADYIGDSTAKTGIYAFDNVPDISLLLVPGQATSEVHNAMLAYCDVARDGMVFAIMDPPAGLGAAAMVDYVSNTASLENASERAAIYWPRVKVSNPSKSVFGASNLLVVPPSGIIAGVFARTDSSSPGGVYVSPAGIEAGRLFGVLGFETEETLNERKRDLVYPHRINPLTSGTGLPRFIDGSRTLKGGGAFPFIAERRGVIFIERSLKQGLQFARHKNNTPELRAQVRRTIIAFLLTQMNNGAFASREPSKAFFVDVSDQLNTPSVAAAGKLVARIGLATNKPAEYIVIQISQDTRALEAELAAAG